ncbi:LysR family transcriptional regulator ArgP [Planktotalea arctica]|uniref:LysR family transcriptional regulator ArgP n=1 Tax=Planktotalea arctica TaxID=1481893 RepID=UPI000A17027B|nr:LysR family transcriptional regulator ArgP [Planktotalea arctica]
MHFDYDQLRALTAILRSGSFDNAAAALGVTPSAISQRLKALEEQVGARLVLRANPCSGTPLGQRLARHAEDVALMEAQLLPQRSGPARISVAVNADSLATWLVPALASQPDLRFDLTIEDQDHSLRLLKEGRVAAAITTRAQPVQGCDSFALGALDYVATASPVFVQRWFADGVNAAALAQAPALIFDRKDDLQRAWALQETGASIALSGHIMPSTQAFVAAALAGMGWGMNPAALVKTALEQGALVALGGTPHFHTPLYWQVSRRLAPQLAGLTRALNNAAKVALVAPRSQNS